MTDRQPRVTEVHLVSSPFLRTLRSLERRSFRGSLLIWLLTAALLAGWVVWFLLVPISVWETTAMARLESRETAGWVEAEINGRVEKVDMVLGQRVSAGQVLVELDSRAQRLDLAVLQAQRGALLDQLAALREQVEVEREVGNALQSAEEMALEEAGARLEGAQAHAWLAADVIERNRRAFAAGQISDLDRLRLEADADIARAASQAAELAQHRLHSEQGANEERRQARLAQLEREIDKLEGRIDTAKAACDRLRYEIGLRRVCAPVAGTVANIAAVRAGTVIRERARLATIVPAEELCLVADYLPASALGRIRPGQRARLRLDGFPWGQYGSLRASVSGVASEIRHGYVRVELDLEVAASPPIQLQHGLSGTVEVEVERVPPTTLLLRFLTRMLGGGSTMPAISGPANTIPLAIHGYRLEVEVAADPVRRAIGMMGRKELPESQGMLFVFPRATQLSFWMRNTFVPLSIAFLDGEGRVLSMEDMEPLDKSSYSSVRPARYALEVRQGWFKARSIMPGDRCDFSLPLGLTARN